jgi:S1-C subfamily serine protease
VLAQLSESVAALTEVAAPLLAAIRTGPNRHVTGLRWSADLLLTAEQGLPGSQSFTVVLPGGALLEAPLAGRDPGFGLAALRISAPDLPRMAGATARTGQLVLVLGAAADASPTARLAAVHHAGPAPQPPATQAILLDLPGHRLEPGSTVIDATGRLLGLTSLGPAEAPAVIGYAALVRFAEALVPAPAATPGSPTAGRPRRATGERGWLGVALQPTTLPEGLRQLAGQVSGRMVVSITPRGPADQAGLRLGDVLLALDGHPASGSHALRAVVSAERIGRRLEVRLLRDGAVRLVSLIVAAQPDG